MTSALSLSYSGSSTLQECERKFCYKYLAKLEQDRDFVSPDYFSMGNAFHKILELTKHEHSRMKEVNLDSLVRSYKLDPTIDGAKIMAMLDSYWPLHKAVGLGVRTCEFRFTGECTNGIIDVVMQEAGVNGWWWMTDLKTTGTRDDKLPARIKRDPQLNLYAAFRAEVAKACALDVNKFAGIRYRETTKPGQKYKAGEDFESYRERCRAGAHTREIVISVEDIDSKEAYGEFLLCYNRATEMQKQFQQEKRFVGRCNFKNCLNYARPCEYFSRCYGKNYTESLSTANVVTQEKIDAMGERKPVVGQEVVSASLLNELGLEDEFS